ncbi:MAG: ATP-binding cassette domain-containing protein [Pseudomonadota bacterium]
MQSIFSVQQLGVTPTHRSERQNSDDPAVDTILTDVSFTLEPGRMLGVVGPNGAGKSTLLKVLARLTQMNDGECHLLGRSFSEYSARAYAHHVAYLEQAPRVAWSLQVEHVVTLAFLNKSFTSEQEKTFSEEAMTRADVLHLRHRVVDTLSGGERMRVMLARLYASQSQVLLLDEPLASLDPAHQIRLMRSLREFVKEGGTVCIVLHDLNHAYSFCDDVLLLHEGRVVVHGAPAEVLSEARIHDVYAVDVTLHNPEGGQPWIQIS